MLEFGSAGANETLRVPMGVELLAPPDAPAAIDCVDEVIDLAAGTYGIAKPPVRWFRPAPWVSDDYVGIRGFVFYGWPEVWLSVEYSTPNGLARTVAHEVTHRWQDVRRGPAFDDMEFHDREHEAQRRAKRLIPNGTYRTPRGRRRDAWFPGDRRVRRSS
jgi:hypothetical protein